MVEGACFYRWTLDGVSAEIVLSLSKQSFGRIFNDMCQETRFFFLTILSEKHCSALSFGCISREWWDALPCVPHDCPTARGSSEFKLRDSIADNSGFVLKDGELFRKVKIRPRVAFRCTSLATCRISSFVTSKRISVSRVFVMII